MDIPLKTINGVIIVASSLTFLFIILNCLWEKEVRASLISTIGLIINTAVWIGFNHFNDLPLVVAFNIISLIVIAIFIIISLIHFFPKEPSRDLGNIEPFDERDNMFSRNNLRNHPELAESYYSIRSDLEPIDRPILEKPEMTAQSMVYYDPLLTPLWDGAFAYLYRIRQAPLPAPSPTKTATDKKEVTEKIKEIAKLYGAIDTGIVRLKPYHFYTHKGRYADNWGEEITNPHAWGIAIIVPMDVGLIKEAPTISTIIESSRKYVEAGKIANIITHLILKLGYDAKPHTDGNYETLCVPIAVDSGIGELSRMGIFLHPVYGPCVRISVVTTNLELQPTKLHNYHISSFCRICKKCADNCPTRSICQEEEPISRGFLHWSINQEKCFSYWKNIGSDCGFCIRVCPYTKPNTLFHKLVRFYITRNPINQRIALFFDDLLYGRKIKIPAENPGQL